MFPWNIARSAEAMFSRWAVKRVCKFLLKKKLGKFILGDIDLDQLDVQLSEGTIQLYDLALNVDYVNKKFGAAASVIVKEGSIGSLLVKMPWKGQGCQVEVNELELVLTPFVDNDSLDDDETCSTSQDGENCTHYGLGKPEREMGDNAATSTSGDVHEGVKTIAKMVRWLLTSFHVKINKLIVAFDPYPEKDKGNIEHHSTLVLQISEIECGSCVSEDVNLNADDRVESFLGISRLTNFVKFEGALVELVQMDDVENEASFPCVSGSSFSELCFGCCSSNATTPILTGQKGGFSGNMKLSIPWKNGSLDIRKVAADVSIDPVELRLQPSTIKWLLHSWETFKNLNEDVGGHINCKSANSDCDNSASNGHLSTLSSPVIPTDGVAPVCGNLSVNFKGQESVTEALLPGSNIIPDWVPLNRNQKDGNKEVDFGASVDQFFECFDGMRNSQSASGNSGMWNWTCSVFSAITAASSLASGSLHIPSEQQHVETSLKATISGITVLLSWHDKEQKHFCDPKGDHTGEHTNVHFLGVKCGDMLLVLQVSPREMKFDGTLKYIEVADYLRNKNDVRESGLRDTHHQTLLIQHLQAAVESALPPSVSSSKDPGSEEPSASVAEDSLFGYKGDLFKILLLKTSGVTHCQFVVNSSSSGSSLSGPTTFSLNLPPFIFWVNFGLVNMLVDLLKKVETSVDRNYGIKRFPSEEVAEKHGTPNGDARRGSGVRVTTLSSTETLRSNVVVTDARIILCFPFESAEDFGGYSYWDQFLALDISSPIAKEGRRSHPDQSSESNSQRRYSSTATQSLHLNVGDLDIYLVTSACKNVAEMNTCGMQKQKFSAQNILSIANRIGCSSVISMVWQEGPVSGPWVAKRARYLAMHEESRNRYKDMEKGYEFASVTTMKDVEELNSQCRQEIILSSAFFLHVHLSPVTINLDTTQYKELHILVNQMINGLASLSRNANSVREDLSVPQTSILLECDSIGILIRLDSKESIKDSKRNELPGSWFSLKLKVEKFNLLSVSSIGGIKGAELFWLVHGEGELRGSITSDPEQEMLLISCSNSTLKRGDGEGSNALSSRLAGLDIVHLWEPQNLHSFTSITLRCGTIVAVGGRLDWLAEIVSFFSLPSPEVEQTGDNDLPKGDLKAPCGASFTLNLVDIGLSYEPHLKNLAVNDKVTDSGCSFSSNSKGMDDQIVSCLLAASSLSLSNTTEANSINNDYKIRVQDLGLLLCQMSEHKDLGGTYSVEHLRKIGYVKVAWEALIEAVLRTNCTNGLLWEVECSKSHIELETCHDTTSAMIGLATQLQQLFAPDMEESVVHLQARWNNAQQAPERNRFDDGIRIFNGDSSPSTSQVHNSSVDTMSKPGVVGLMDEICENAFCLEGKETCRSDFSESQVGSSLDETLLEESCSLKIYTPENFSHDLSFKGSVPVVGLESSKSSFLQKGCLPQLIEGYCLSEVHTISELSVDKPELGNDSGWYGDASLNIVENHISKLSKQTRLGKLPSVDPSRPNSFSEANGRVLLKNINVRWRMYGGSDWQDSVKIDEHSTDVGGRDTAVCIELALSGMKVQYDVFPVGGVDVSKLSLSVKDFHLFDKSRNAPWKLVLVYYHSKDHPRQSSSKAFKMELECVRPEPLIPLEEYRLRIAFLPVLLHLHQSQLDFLVSYFGAKDLPADLSLGCQQDLGDSKSSPMKNNNFAGHTISEEALLPYFQKFDIRPFVVRVDYSPRRVDLAALRGGKYVELVNLVPWKGVELQLKHVQATGVYGWSSVCETIVGEWLEDISQNQIQKVLQGLPTIRSLVAVGAGAKKLVSLPVENYRKEHRVLKGMQRGTIAFLRSISLEAVGLGVHLAAGAQEILLQAEYILTTIPPSVPWSVQSRTKTNVRSNQPKDAQEGLQQAYESLSDGLGRSASALVRTPLKKYQRGAGAGSVLATAVRAVPAATIAPATACLSAAHYALLGFRNSLDPERKKESMEKYLGPTHLRE